MLKEVVPFSLHASKPRNAGNAPHFETEGDTREEKALCWPLSLEVLHAVSVDLQSPWVSGAYSVSPGSLWLWDVSQWSREAFPIT